MQPNLVSTKTPILIIIFNRPDKTKRLIEALSAVRPSEIYVSADGPRPNVVDDAKKCVEARKIATEIWWPCKVYTNFSDKNLGCKIGVSSAINWFFSKVESGIILEDDCIPSESFFTFASDLLEKYKNDRRIMHISGTTFLEVKELSNPSDSYFFSKIPHVWGWATWKRAWNLYDIEMKNLDNMEKMIKDKNSSMNKFWINLFKHVRDKKIDTWDSQWVYSIMSNNGLSITPAKNLIENIGFDNSATHTKNKNKLSGTAVEMELPLSHPSEIKNDIGADKILMKKSYTPNLFKKIWYKVSSIW